MRREQAEAVAAGLALLALAGLVITVIVAAAIALT